MSLFSRLLVLVCTLAGVAALSSLGVWQVQRLHWKEALLAQIDSRRHGAPEPLADVEARYAGAGDVDYFPVRLTGTFDHGGESYFYTTHEGQAGWDVFAPLTLEDGRIIFVDRGFVPMARRDPSTRTEGQIAGALTVIGLARNPLSAKPNSFVPENDVPARTLYWRSLADMARIAGVEPASALPFYVDAGPAPNPGGLPVGGTTLISLPNNHFGYAVTWFGLAVALAGVGGWFLFTRRSRVSGA